ncbi:GFA family protein [Novosphingobium sp. 9U]|uniref:GFA family protein n=1 Tax=Novosphingobium sp. 9U TaxID=2653158 RepID=UPI0012F38EA4|nr:GFA family protein [Novosphingobium sp. 9U]VWX55181.1 Aldehyde-activating protein [Novosphingobium sp. 9U]
MPIEGGCRCKQVRYSVEGEPQHTALCHCSDCRSSSGAPVVAWTAFNADRFTVTAGEARVYNGAGEAYRHFCGNCGTGLWYVNEPYLPGIVDIQTATFDDPEAFVPGAHIQVAEELSWMRTAHDLPHFDRYPG